MKVQGWVMTNRVGSKVHFDVEIYDEDLVDCTAGERDNLIAEQVQEAMWNYIEWGWKP